MLKLFTPLYGTLDGNSSNLYEIRDNWGDLPVCIKTVFSDLNLIQAWGAHCALPSGFCLAVPKRFAGG